MTIIMSYHCLVERDSRFVSRKWQIITILILMGIAGFNLVAGFKVHSLDINFKEHCFINSKITFKTVIPELVVQDHFDEGSNSGNNDDSTFEDYRISSRNIPSNMNQKEFHDKDRFFFGRAEIDEYATVWGYQRNCIFISITPLFFSFCAIIWIAMFLTCGHGGTTKSFIVANPWKIVIPALICFIAAAISNFILLMVLKSAMDTFCSELNQHLYSHYYCGFLLEKFSLIPQGDSNFTTNCYSTILRTLTAANLLWLVAALVMILRIIFVIDFQLVRVTISLVRPRISVEQRSESDDELDFDTEEDSPHSEEHHETSEYRLSTSENN